MNNLLIVLPVIAGVVGTLLRDTFAKVLTTMLADRICKHTQTKQYTPNDSIVEVKLNMKSKVSVSIKIKNDDLSPKSHHFK